MGLFNQTKAEAITYDENFTGSYLSFGKSPKPTVWEKVKNFVTGKKTDKKTVKKTDKKTVKKADKKTDEKTDKKTDKKQKHKAKRATPTPTQSKPKQLTKEDLNLNVQLTDKMVDIFKKAEKTLKMEEELQEKTLEE